VLAAATLLALAARPTLAIDDATTVAALAPQTHFHGLAVDAKDPSRLFLATHHGLYAVGMDDMARRVSEAKNDFMGFTAHPREAGTLFSSGHPPAGGNLGFLVSHDSGRNWTKLSDGVGGPVDFHQMDVSKLDPKVIYGVFRGLQKSTDGGLSWSMVGPMPEGIIDLAVSARDADTLYAATQRGLLRSTDGGRAWAPAHMMLRPATLVRTTRAGDLYAFIAGGGLMRAKEDSLAWQTLSNGFGDSFVVHLAIDPTDAQRLYAVTLHAKTQLPALLASRDGGANWRPLGAP
jgi:photosystem II stability/assembly factor-like uncharacterized protein